MFNFLFFIPMLGFCVLAIVFYLAISNVEKIPNAVNFNIGNLNADDISKLDYSRRNYLRNQVVFYFAMAAIVTFLIGIIFIIFVNTDTALLALPCDLIGTIVGLLVAFRVIKKANTLKEEIF